MNEKLFVPSLILVLLVVISGFAMMQSNQNKYNTQIVEALHVIAERQQSASLPPTSPSTQPAPTPAPTTTTPSSNGTANETGYNSYSGWDLAFEYPKTFFVTKYADEFRNNQINLRITSQKGKLFRTAGGPAQPQKDEFTSGYEMDIVKVMDAQETVNAVHGQLVLTANPLIKRIDFTCDGAGCDQGQYLITSRKGTYLIRLNTGEYDDQTMLTVTEHVLNSIHE